jgi:hypothetical protein
MVKGGKKKGLPSDDFGDSDDDKHSKTKVVEPVAKTEPKKQKGARGKKPTQTAKQQDSQEEDDDSEKEEKVKTGLFYLFLFISYLFLL